MESDAIVGAALNTAHDALLEGLGYAGIHPGYLAQSLPVVQKMRAGLRFVLVSAAGEELNAVRFEWP